MNGVGPSDTSIFSSICPAPGGWSTARAVDESPNHARATASAVKSKSRRKGDRLIEFVVGEVFVLIKQSFLFPRLANYVGCGSRRGGEPTGKSPPPDSDPFSDVEPDENYDS